MTRILLSLINADEEPTGTIKAFKKSYGEENVYVFDYMQMERDGKTRTQINEDFKRVCAEWQPNICHAQYQESNVITPETLRAVREMAHKPFLTIWMGDWRSSVPSYTAAVSRECDLVLISSVGQIQMYKDATGGADVRYWQIGVDWEQDMNYDVEKPSLPHPRLPKVVFSGRYYSGAFPGSEERLAVCQAFADSGLDFAVVGAGFPPSVPCVGSSPRRFQKWVYKAAKLSIGVNNANATHLYYSERQLQAMASGTCHLCWRIPGLEEEFTDGVDCVMFDSPADAVEKAKALMADDARRAEIGAAGRERILKEHTWDSRIRQHGAMLPAELFKITS